MGERFYRARGRQSHRADRSLFLSSGSALTASHNLTRLTAEWRTGRSLAGIHHHGNACRLHDVLPWRDVRQPRRVWLTIGCAFIPMLEDSSKWEATTVTHQLGTAWLSAVCCRAALPFQLRSPQLACSQVIGTRSTAISPHTSQLLSCLSDLSTSLV